LALRIKTLRAFSVAVIVSEILGLTLSHFRQLVAELMQMPAAEARVKSLQADVNTISEALKAKQAELEELKARQSGSEKMNVDLNVQYRQARQKMKDQEEVVRAKKREAATANLEQRKVEMNEAQKLLDAQTSKFNQHVGARSSVLAQIEAKTQQISKENKTDVDESWRTTFIQLKVRICRFLYLPASL
jgi:chromosome segregation ATPase